MMKQPANKADMHRLFIAIPLSDRVREGLHLVQLQLKRQLPEVNWANPETMHLTLHFLGDQPDDLVAKIADIVVCVGSSTPPFQLALQGLGAFPSAQRARVLWAGLQDRPETVRLHAQLATELKTIGIIPETRRYKPHLTLGRLRKRPIRVSEVLAGFGGGLPDSLPVKELILYRSRLLPTGAEHLPVVTVPLEGGGIPDQTLEG